MKIGDKVRLLRTYKQYLCQKGFHAHLSKYGNRVGIVSGFNLGCVAVKWKNAPYEHHYDLHGHLLVIPQ